jgi:centrosomal protein CEP76
LIPFCRSEAVGGGRNETWHSIFTCLAMNKMDCEDHCILLASLFLGLGLDAYIAVGTVEDDEGGEKDHLWVVTRQSRR